MSRQIRILDAGSSSTVQDLGRPGWHRAGVGAAGAADRASYALANRLVANDVGAAAIECLIGGLQFAATTDVLFAVTGAPVSVTVDGKPMGMNCSVFAPAGVRVMLGIALRGMRTYVAFRGGIDVEPVLGSRSHDSLSGIGPPPLRSEDVLPLGIPSPTQWPAVDFAPVPPMPSGEVRVRVLLGPRDDWFDNPEDLFAGRWSVSDQTDRIGMRLTRTDGSALRRRDTRELPSEGMALGSIQVPPDGDPIVFLVDHPVTGGYPVVGTVVTADVDRLAQMRPGQILRFG